MISEEKFKKKEIINKSKKSKALFLDRDGVINIDYGYVHKKENFEFSVLFYNVYYNFFVKKKTIKFINTIS